MQSVLRFAGITALIMLAHGVYPQISDFRQTDFSKADSIAARYPSHSLKNLPLLAHKLTHSLASEPEKFRAIFRWVCDNIDNDYNMFIQNKRKRERLDDPVRLAAWNNKVNAMLFRKLLHEQKTICTGYAYLLKELCSHAGIQVEIVHGYGRNLATTLIDKPNHSWNAVRLNGKWYLCDPTWSAGVNDPRTSTFTRKFDDAYFLSEPATFIRKHYPIDTTWTLLRQNPTFEEFNKGPIVYSNAFAFELYRFTPEHFVVTVQKDKPVVFEFATKNQRSMKSIALRIHMHEVYREDVIANDSGLLKLSHTFRSKGKFVVHVAIDDKVTHSYSITVED